MFIDNFDYLSFYQVDKNWNFYLFPYASQMDWTSNKTSVLYYRSDTYLKTLVKKCYNVNPDSLFEEDLYSFYIFLTKLQVF